MTNIEQTRAAASAPKAELADERAAFEAWGEELFNYGFEPETWHANQAEYKHEGTQMAWEGWQARAVLAQAAPVAALWQAAEKLAQSWDGVESDEAADVGATIRHDFAMYAKEFGAAPAAPVADAPDAKLRQASASLAFAVRHVTTWGSLTEAERAPLSRALEAWDAGSAAPVAAATLTDQDITGAAEQHAEEIDEGREGTTYMFSGEALIGFVRAVQYAASCGQSAPVAAAVPAEPTSQQIYAAARKMCDLSAEACGVDKDDNWKVYGDAYNEEAKLVLTAALAAPAQETAS